MRTQTSSHRRTSWHPRPVQTWALAGSSLLRLVSGGELDLAAGVAIVLTPLAGRVGRVEWAPEGEADGSMSLIRGTHPNMEGLLGKTDAVYAGTPRWADDKTGRRIYLGVWKLIDMGISRAQTEIINRAVRSQTVSRGYGWYRPMTKLTILQAATESSHEMECTLSALS